VFDYAGLADESGEAKDKSTLAKPEAERESNSAQTERRKRAVRLRRIPPIQNIGRMNPAK